ncbi:MAG: hypothetical protein ACJART_000284 [Maribacter sp.]|jgi:hypothetical protein
MKLEILYIGSFLLMSFMFLSCETSDDEMENTGISLTEIKANAESGTWTVSLFEEEGIDETSDFTGFGFTFNSGGVLSAVDGDNSITGAWSITSDDDTNEDAIEFNIFFASPLNFAELSEDWDIVSYSDTRIELKDIGEGDDSTDRLIFEKL